MRIPFRERNPVPLGLTFLGLVVVFLLLLFNLKSLPFVSNATTYHAAFAEAAGLKSGEEVRIAGVKVGTVQGLGLQGDHVKVDFTVDNGVRVGDLSRVQIKIKTLLGSHYLEVDPAGPYKQNPHQLIPVSRTTTPFEVVPAISQLSQHISQIDTNQLAKSFQTISDTFKNSPAEVKASLVGLSRLSNTISSRNDQLHQLLGRTTSVTQVLADRNQQIAALLGDGRSLLQALSDRREVIHTLLVNTIAVSAEINGLIGDNQAQLNPMLKNLERVNGILLKNQDNLDATIRLLAPYASQFTDATGTGRWFDSFIQNLIPIPASIGNVPGSQSSPKSKSPSGSSGNPFPFLQH
jgi:phospholipid/cholesterol/gamma-HCH transport system substrate-binding protein